MKTQKGDAKNKIEKTVAEFNKYRSPEATARLVSLKGNLLEVEFAGHFCRTCGFYDYFDDFKIILEEAGLKSEIDGIEEKEGGALVKFKF